MADFFIRRPIVAMVIAILTVIVGLVSLKRLPIAEYPPVSPTMIQVTTTYRGAAAEAVMESVATPIESKVNGVDKLLYMQSFSANDGKLTLNAYFDVGTDVDIMQVNAQKNLRPGMFARIKVDTGTRSDSILVPERAVAELQGKTFVWVIGADAKATQRAVKVGETIGENVLIVEGLKAGERIVTEGLQKVREGASVQPKTAAEMALASKQAEAPPAKE